MLVREKLAELARQHVSYNTLEHICKNRRPFKYTSNLVFYVVWPRRLYNECHLEDVSSLVNHPGLLK